MSIRKTARIFGVFILFFASCMKVAQITSIRENPAKTARYAKELREKSPIKTAAGVQISLWASDTLAPDPIAMATDDYNRMYVTRSNRMKNSEFDIRGHQDWIIPSISLQSVEERRAFLREIFAPEKSKDNEWHKDLNFDGTHDWQDLAVEKEEIWRLEDTNKDGYADVSTRIFNDLHNEVTDVAAGLLIRRKDAFLAAAPDIWHLEDKNGDGIYDKKDKMASISTGYGVHIGFSGHNLSGLVEGPDGRIYWNIGDIGANITAVDGAKYDNANSGLIARANPDGSDFEIFATGLRNTHEFVFDDYGNLISADNDGDHPGERERLVHIVEGSDAGWRSNWQYGKYTDPKNNKYKVWMDEKLSVPRWDGQAAYIIPPIMNYHNGPTGMILNPGNALGSAWRNKFFLVEFVGTPTRSHIWSFGLKPKGASFELDGETDLVSGILPTGIQFGADGALYIADWVNGWDTKNYGRIWKLDVTPDKNDLAAQRAETERLMRSNYDKMSTEKLLELLSYSDRRIRQKAQFALVAQGKKGLPFLKQAVQQTQNQLARVHGIWGIGQLLRNDKTLATHLIPLLKDNDDEIKVQAMKMLGDAEITSIGTELLALLTHPSARVQFYAAEVLGQIRYEKASQPLLKLLEVNDDRDLYVRHAAVLALSRILCDGSREALFRVSNHVGGKERRVNTASYEERDISIITNLKNSPSKALRTAAVLILRRLKSPSVTTFLNDKDEYIQAEAARAINDDHSIPSALPQLAAVLTTSKSTSEPLIRRAINAALRVGNDQTLNYLMAYAQRTDITDVLKSEAIATLGTWTTPSVLDRVDGRLRGKVERNLTTIREKIKPLVNTFLESKNSETLIAVAGLLANLGIDETNDKLAKIFYDTKDSKVKIAILPALNSLKFNQLGSVIKIGMEDENSDVRTKALSLLNNSNVTKETLPYIATTIFTKGSVREQQQLLAVMSQLDAEKTSATLDELLDRAAAKKLSPNLNLELKEAVEATKSASLMDKLAKIQPKESWLVGFAEALYGGNRNSGRDIFLYNSTAQCSRCHALGTEGGAVGPELSNIGRTLTREQLLQAMIEPSARLAAGYGSVSLKLKDGQEVFGILAKETEHELTIKTNDAEPLVIQTARIAKRENQPSSMPAFGESLTKREIRDLVEYLATLKK